MDVSECIVDIDPSAVPDGNSIFEEAGRLWVLAARCRGLRVELRSFDVPDPKSDIAIVAVAGSDWVLSVNECKQVSARRSQSPSRPLN